MMKVIKIISMMSRLSFSTEEDSEGRIRVVGNSRLERIMLSLKVTPNVNKRS